MNKHHNNSYAVHRRRWQIFKVQIGILVMLFHLLYYFARLVLLTKG